MKTTSIILGLTVVTQLALAQATKPAASDKNATPPQQQQQAIKLTPEAIKKLIANEEKRHKLAMQFIKDIHDFQLKNLNENKQMSTDFENKLYEYNKTMVRANEEKVITHLNAQRTKLTEDYQNNQKSKNEQFSQEMTKKQQAFQEEIKKFLPQ